MLDILIAFAASMQAPAAQPACVLDEAAKQANAALSFDDFDQRGTLPSTARALGEAGCWREAADATSDYLIRGPVAAPFQQRIMLFHLGQQLAYAGDERLAARFVAAARAPIDPSAPARLNWNDFVRGTWAFLVKDRTMLIAARDALLAGTGEGDAMNGAMLAAMERCFDRSYLDASNPAICPRQR